MRILAAVDRSDFSDDVAGMAMRIAAAPDSKVLLIHAAPREPDLLGQQLTRKVISTPVPEELRDRRELLDRLAGVISAAGVACETLLIRGEPAHTIQREAKRWGADLVVMGSQGRGMITRKLMGSVSEEVLRRGQLPVLIMPPSPPGDRV